MLNCDPDDNCDSSRVLPVFVLPLTFPTLKKDNFNAKWILFSSTPLYSVSLASYVSSSHIWRGWFCFVGISSGILWRKDCEDLVLVFCLQIHCPTWQKGTKAGRAEVFCNIRLLRVNKSCCNSLKWFMGRRGLCMFCGCGFFSFFSTESKIL